MSAASSSAGGASADATATRTATSRPSSAAKESSVGRVVAGCERAVQSVLFQQSSHRRSLVRGDRRQHLEDLAAVARDEPLRPCRLRDRVELPHRLALVRAAAEVEGHREPFHLDLGLRPRRVGRELRERAPPALGLRLELEPVRADADHALRPRPARARPLPPVRSRPRRARIARRAARARRASRAAGAASSGRATIGASTPSKSRNRPAWPGSEASRSSSASAATLKDMQRPAIIQACRISTSSGSPS